MLSAIHKTYKQYFQSLHCVTYTVECLLLARLIDKLSVFSTYAHFKLEILGKDELPI